MRTAAPTRSPTRCAIGSSTTTTRGAPTPMPPPGEVPPVPDVLAAEGSIGTPAINISIFAVFVAITLIITFQASRTNRSAADYYAAGRSISGTQNGLAIAGHYLSAASFLGIAGAIAVFGYD